MIGRTNAVVIQSSQNQPVPESPTTHKVIFIDQFGVVNEQWVEDGTNAIVPTPRVYDYLTFVEWNQSTENVTEDRVIGATYDTTDGKTYVFITLTDVTGLDLVIYLNKSDGSTLTIDWGDETTSTFTNSGNFNTGTHTYAAAGNYIITMWISVGTGTYSFGNGTTATTFVGGSSQNYRNTLRKLYIGDSVTSIVNYPFTSCYSLTSISIPSSVTLISAYAFSSCYSLTSISIPNSVTSIGNNAFQSCYSLTSISISNSVTSIGNIAFQSCYSLTSISIPNSVTSIGNIAFENCFSILEYKIYATTPPTLVNINAFTSINPICKIYVPDASLTAYKTATNWATYANYIYPLSDIGE